MSKIKLSIWSSIFIYTLIFLLISFTSWTPPAQASFCRIFPLLCGKTGRNLHKRGLATRRGSCASTAENLIALVPEDVQGDKQQDGQELRVELTTAQAYPTFWFYLPSYPSTVEEARFILLDADKHPVLDEPIKIELPQTSGIAEFTLPNTEKSLEVGQQYTWYFEVVCDRRNPDRNPIVRGQIKRIEQDPQLGNQYPEYVVSANNGVVWYDTLTQFVRNHNLDSQDWMDLLGSEILEPESIAQEPIVLQPMN